MKTKLTILFLISISVYHVNLKAPTPETLWSIPTKASVGK